jgi:hypothetical protein
MAANEYWSVREAAYRAMARGASTPDGAAAWTALADRCAAMGAQADALEHGTPPFDVLHAPSLDDGPEAWPS